MKPLLFGLAVLAMLLGGFRAHSNSSEPELESLGWPSWLEVGLVVRLPEQKNPAVASTNAVLIQNYNPTGSNGTARVGHLGEDGRFTAFETDARIRKIEIGALAAIELQVSGLTVSVAENLQTLSSGRHDRKSKSALGAARLFASSVSRFNLAPPSDSTLQSSRVDSGPLGQISVAGRFFKLATPFQVAGQRFDVLHFSDYETYDRGQVTFGNLGPNSDFVPNRLPIESWTRFGTTTSIGGINTPVFLIEDGAPEIYHKLVGGREDSKVVQSSELSVLEIAKRTDIYTLALRCEGLFSTVY